MIITKPSIEFMDMNTLGLNLIERAGRTCWKSEDKIGPGTAEKFATMLLEQGHYAMLEFGWLCYIVVCDRGITHEIVRHRLYSFAQESTRYVTYKSGATFILPPWMQFVNEQQFATPDITTSQEIMEYFPYIYSDVEYLWFTHLRTCEIRYKECLAQGWSAQKARSVLPNALKTEIVMAGNTREWMHFFKLRCHSKAHPQMQEIANMIRADAKRRIPILFEENANV